MMSLSLKINFKNYFFIFLISMGSCKNSSVDNVNADQGLILNRIIEKGNIEGLEFEFGLDSLNNLIFTYNSLIVDLGKNDTLGLKFKSNRVLIIEEETFKLASYYYDRDSKLIILTKTNEVSNVEVSMIRIANDLNSLKLINLDKNIFNNSTFIAWCSKENELFSSTSGVGKDPGSIQISRFKYTNGKLEKIGVYNSSIEEDSLFWEQNKNDSLVFEKRFMYQIQMMLAK